MSDYDAFSICYDLLTENVDYAKRSNYLLSLFEAYDRKPTLLLDLACGTGGFSYEFVKKGIDVIGVDRSEGMLSAAKAKQLPPFDNPLFLCQPAEELELFGTVDGAVCLLDSLNHITDYNRLCKALSKVSLFLEKDRLFIFDLNTPYKHEKVLGGQTFVTETEEAFCVWQNEYAGNGMVDIFLDIFMREANGQYTRLSEEFSERAYTATEMKKALAASGFAVLAVLDDLSDHAPLPDSERIICITRKM